MNIKFPIAVISLLIAIVFASCDKDDINSYIPNDAVVASLSSKYPAARNIEWEMEGGYDVADFKDNGVDIEAWFASNGEWVMSKSDISYGVLPEAVKSSFQSGIYADWQRDDICKLERLGMETVYVIVVERGEQEVDLYYSSEGVLVKEDKEGAGTEHYMPALVPQKIGSFIAGKYPNASIVECDLEKDSYQVDIVDEGVCKELLFTRNFTWLSIQWEISLVSVPQPVKDAFKASSYSSYEIDEIDYKEDASGDAVYLFELEKGDTDILLTIDETGKISI